VLAPSRWFPAKQVGVAEGIYGGWGNFGSAFAAMTLPTLALWYGGEDMGWRYAIITTGVIASIYAVVYYLSVHNTPRGSTYFKPKKTGGMEVTSKGDFFLYLFMNIPMYAALAVLTWKLGQNNLKMLTGTMEWGIYAGLVFCIGFRRLKFGTLTIMYLKRMSQKLITTNLNRLRYLILRTWLRLGRS
jgi:NNP family nitrate/nitrite transporter-like MFS transporter